MEKSYWRVVFLNDTVKEHRSKLFEYEGKINYMETTESLYHVLWLERQHKTGEMKLYKQGREETETCRKNGTTKGHQGQKTKRIIL